MTRSHVLTYIDSRSRAGLMKMTDRFIESAQVANLERPMCHSDKTEQQVLAATTLHLLATPSRQTRSRLQGYKAAKQGNFIYPMERYFPQQSYQQTSHNC